MLFDLTFVIAFGAAASELAHYLAEGHVPGAIGAFAFAVFAVSWAWGHYTSFASAFDNDDWLFRIATLVQMVGVIILTLGLPPMFESLDSGEHFDNALGVVGYVVMRVAVLTLWVRVAITDLVHRSAALTYVATIAIAQLGWIATAIAELPVGVFFVATVPLFLVELAGPLIAERRKGGTPWHPNHIAERYGLLVIITLGEVVLGTVTAVSALVAESGWSFDAIVVTLSGTTLAFGIWWVYFIVPSAVALRRHRTRIFAWAYLHLVVFGSITAVGAGLHVAALAVGEHSSLSTVGVVLTIAVPMLVLWVTIFALYSLLYRTFDAFHVPLFIGAVLALAAAVVAAALGASISVAIAMIVASPVIVIVGYERVGHRHQAALLERLRHEDES